MIINSYPFATFPLTSFSRRVAAGERIEYQIPDFGKKPNKKRGNLNRETRGVWLYFVGVTEASRYFPFASLFPWISKFEGMEPPRSVNFLVITCPDGRVFALYPTSNSLRFLSGL